jgi:TetR/AcrR family transcriptional regulator
MAPGPRSKRVTASTPTARKRGQWKELPSADDLRDRKTSALFRQAALAFHQQGYAETSIADIADRLGVSKAALYHYIGNKQELLFQCHLAASDAADEALALVPKEGMTGLEKLRTGLRCYLDSILSENSASVVALEESALTPENFKRVMIRRDRFQRRFEGFVSEGIADGSILPCDVKLATFGVLGGVNWVEKWYRPDGPWTANQIAAAMADMMVRSLAVKPKPLPLHVTDYPDLSAEEQFSLPAHSSARTPTVSAARGRKR